MVHTLSLKKYSDDIMFFFLIALKCYHMAIIKNIVVHCHYRYLLNTKQLIAIMSVEQQ